MRNRYQSEAKKSRKFEVIGERELLVPVPVPLRRRPAVVVPTMVARLFSFANAAIISPALVVC